LTNVEQSIQRASVAQDEEGSRGKSGCSVDDVEDVAEEV